MTNFVHKSEDCHEIPGAKLYRLTEKLAAWGPQRQIEIDFPPPKALNRRHLSNQLLRNIWLLQEFQTIELWTKVMRKEARHTQMRDRASGVHPDVLEHLPPKKTRVCLLYCFVLSALISLGAVPHHHLALSVKELTYSSNS